MIFYYEYYFYIFKIIQSNILNNLKISIHAQSLVAGFWLIPTFDWFGGRQAVHVRMSGVAPCMEG